MSSLFKSPKRPRIPTMPDIPDPQVAADARRTTLRKRKTEIAARGRASTIIASGGPDGAAKAPVVKKTLLGGG